MAPLPPQMLPLAYPTGQYVVPATVYIQPAVSVPYVGTTITFYPPLPVPQLVLNLPYPMPPAE